MNQSMAAGATHAGTGTLATLLSITAWLAALTAGPADASEAYSLTVIADSRSFGGATFIQQVSLNDQGVAAWATSQAVSGGVTSGLYIGDGSFQQQVLTNTSRQSAVLNPSINNRGQVGYSFNPSGSPSIRYWDAGNTVTLVPGPSFSSWGGGLSDNARIAQNRQTNGGLLIFSTESGFGMSLGSMSTGNTPVISRNGSLAALYGASTFGSTALDMAFLDQRSGGRIFAFGSNLDLPTRLAINNHGNVVYSTGPGANPDFIGVINGRDIAPQTRVLATQGQGGFGAFNSGVSINNFNEVTFIGNVGTGSRGLFRSDTSGAAPVAMALPGETVAALGGASIVSVQAIDQHSMNDLGQVAFLANMRTASNQSFVALLRADPIEGISPGRPILPIEVAPGPAPVWTMPIVRMPAGSIGGTSRPRTNYDPDIAIGYIYEVSAGAPNFSEVQIPAPLANGDDSFIVSFGGHSYALKAGDVFDFMSVATGGVPTFSITGIDVGESLDPQSSTAFVTALGFAEGGLANSTFTMKPITISAVPEPPAILLALIGVAALLWRIRREPALLKNDWA